MKKAKMTVPDLRKYVVDNYDSLPKSTFNDTELVVVNVISNDDSGWGNHYFSGLGLSKAGSFYWCFSSGCSCNGSCGANRQTMKTLETDDKKFLEDAAKNFDPSKVQSFNFSDYE